MSHIKSALEIAMEKSEKINKLSSQEMAEIKQQEKIDRILARYYKGKIEADDLWHHLKGVPDKCLVNAQQNFLQSITFQSNTYHFKRRRNGILAIENLKKANQLSEIELDLHQLENIQKEFLTKKEQFMTTLKEELQKDPQKRMQTFQQGNQIIIKQLSVEEALEQNKQWQQHLQQIENQYRNQFGQIKDNLLNSIKYFLE